MGVLKRFEQRLEGLVNGTFAKVFKSEVQPVEIAGALQRECDNNATIWNRERTVVPNDFIVELSAPDYDRLAPYSGQLGEELAAMVRDYAQQQRYTFMGPIKVHLEKAEDLDTGLYRIRSRTLAGSHSQAPASRPHAGGAPAAPGAPPGPGAPTAPTGPTGPGGPPGYGAQPGAPGGGYGDYGDYGDYGRPPRHQPPPMPAAPPPGAPAAPPPGGPPPGPLPGGARRLRHWLEINGVRHQMTRQSLVLGRSTEADVRIDDPGVSRRHCEIRTFDGGAMVQDLGSTNGIVVDDQHTQRATLRDGSRIRVGSTTVLYRQAEG